MDYKDLILDMLSRIVKLEQEVERLKKEINNNATSDFISEGETLEPHNCAMQPLRRDKTRYLFNGNIYLKNRLVLAVVKDYISKNLFITCKELKEIFNKSLQGSIGVVEYENIAKQRNDYQVRFFAKDNELLRLVDGNMLVCSQWGILNIPNFIKRAEQLGYTIKPIERE